jgi:hypothetical protein
VASEATPAPPAPPLQVATCEETRAVDRGERRAPDRRRAVSSEASIVEIVVPPWAGEGTCADPQCAAAAMCTAVRVRSALPAKGSRWALTRCREKLFPHSCLSHRRTGMPPFHFSSHMNERRVFQVAALLLNTTRFTMRTST